MAQAEAGSGGIWYADPPLSVRLTWNALSNVPHPDYYLGIWVARTAVGGAAPIFPIGFQLRGTQGLNTTEAIFNPMSDGTVEGRQWVINGTHNQFTNDFHFVVSLMTRSTNIAVFPGQLEFSPLTLTVGKCGEPA